jgi:hypothetical protein
MRIKDWTTLIDEGSYSSSPEYAHVRSDVESAVAAIVYPPDNDRFVINPVKKGNGVKPIKEGFTTYLHDHGWELEKRGFKGDSARPGAFDCYYEFPEHDGVLPFAVEWETGNISSSHRAINRLALGILREQLSGGLLVVPSHELYPYLTDRVGNEAELLPYHPLWEQWDHLSEKPHHLGILVVEQDGFDASVPTIKKGTDGRALV